MADRGEGVAYAVVALLGLWAYVMASFVGHFLSVPGATLAQLLR